MPKSKVRKKAKDKARERQGGSQKESECVDRCCPPSPKP